jgi:hypothetical protein
MDEVMYLLDNNVLSHLSRDQRESDFFFSRCRVSTEVAHEADGYIESNMLERVEFKTTKRVLELLQTVMATVEVGDRRLVDLYANKGAADPLLIACAMSATEDAGSFLWGPVWVVVSNDKAVQEKAEAFTVPCISREAFFAQTVNGWA